MFRLEITITNDSHCKHEKGLHDWCTRRRIAEIGTANVAGFDYVSAWNCHSAARTIVDIRFVHIWGRTLTYHDPFAIFSFHSFSANGFRCFIKSSFASFHMKHSLMLGDVHWITAQSIHVGSTIPTFQSRTWSHKNDQTEDHQCPCWSEGHFDRFTENVDIFISFIQHKSQMSDRTSKRIPRGSRTK